MPGWTGRRSLRGGRARRRGGRKPPSERWRISRSNCESPRSRSTTWSDSKRGCTASRGKPPRKPGLASHLNELLPATIPASSGTPSPSSRPAAPRGLVPPLPMMNSLTSHPLITNLEVLLAGFPAAPLTGAKLEERMRTSRASRN